MACLLVVIPAMPNPSLGKGGFRDPQVTKFDIDGLPVPKFFFPGSLGSNVCLG